MPSVVADVIHYVLYAFWLLLLVRLVADWVFALSRARARGPMAAVLELVYSVTDPPLKGLRRVLPPLRIGNFALDVGFLLVIIGVRILMSVVAPYR